MAHGGKREGAGRKKQAVTQLAKDIKALAIPHAPAAIEALVKIMLKDKNSNARVSAAKELLDRGFGKATQYVEGSLDVFLADKILNARKRVSDE